ncbi:nitroreductase family protein [Azospirillum sp. TSO22-1]|uniref:nitroreductase family protein n=1 Tax=Azospirillum sp. TSO22-1 TaxID=716789 RepID=UPI000D60F6DF|nr:nitroreductase family protein [Azospirillum sp. TSO22-1]PWC40375.1 nitroreductase [Azospirillum sp. TSO22-1]
MPVSAHRRPDRAIDPLFVNRWSPRAYSGEEIPDAVLELGFEAARWAPSARNAQPWRFVYSKRHSSSWESFAGLLNARNRQWAGNASALVAVLSRTTHDDGTPILTHSFDTGAAWANFAHQVVLAGWHTRAIGGFDHAAARTVLGVPEDHAVEILIAIGRQAAAETLPDEFRTLETPNGRRPLSAFVSEGAFGTP